MRFIAAIIGAMIVGATFVHPQDKAASPRSPATLIPNLSTLTIHHPREVAKGVLTFSASSYNWANLCLRAQPLKQASYAASFRFPKLGNAGYARLDDPALGCHANSPCPIDFEIIDLKARGTYTGAIELYAGTERLASATISALLPDVGPAPIIVRRNSRLDR